MHSHISLGKQVIHLPRQRAYSIYLSRQMPHSSLKVNDSSFFNANDSLIYQGKQPIHLKANDTLISEGKLSIHPSR